MCNRQKCRTRQTGERTVVGQPPADGLCFAFMSQGSIITVGNFDGVHLGHGALLEECCRAQESHTDAQIVAMAFTEHPLTNLRPEKAPPPLCDRVQREKYLVQAGAEKVQWLSPDEKTLGQPPEVFAQRVVDAYQPRVWVEGADFRFGKGRTGDVKLLRELGSVCGFEVRVVEPVQVVLADKSQVTVSSSLVRFLVAHGRVLDVVKCLGRSFSVRGEVVRGDNRGRELGFPTVNLDCGDRLLPSDGVYAGRVEVDEKMHRAAISVGTKPALGTYPRVFEAHLLDFEGNLYGQTLEVHVERWLRDQYAVPGIDALIAQMERDVHRIREAA